MANKVYTTMSEESIRYLCGLIRDLASVSEGVDDLHLASNSTFSSVKIDTLIKQCLQDSNEYTDRLVANLSRLELKIATSESEITQPNTMYLYKPSGSTSYEQYVVIEGTKVLLGTCDIDMADYYTITQTDAKFTLLTDFNNLKDAFDTLKEKVGDTTKLNNATLMEEVQDKVDKADVVTALDDTVTDGQVASALLTKTELDNKADRSYVDDNFVTMDKVGTITTVTLPDYTSKNVNGTFADEAIGTISLQAGKYIIVSQAIMSNFSDFSVVGVVGLCMENYQFRCAPAVNRENTIQLNCIMNLTEAKQLSLRYIGHHNCQIHSIMINVMKIG